MKSQLNFQKNLASMALLFASVLFLFASCSKDEMVAPSSDVAADRLITNQTKGNESNAVAFHGTKKYTFGKSVGESASSEISDAKISEYKKSDSKLDGVKMESDAKSHSIGFSSNDKFSPAAPALSSSSGVDGYKKADKTSGIKMMSDAKSHVIGENAGDKVSDEQFHEMPAAWIIKQKEDDDKCGCNPKQEVKKLILEKNER